MKILTIGDSWTYGTNSSDPLTKSWPAQMAKKYDVDVVNLARAGSSNKRAARIAIEELSRNPNYDFVIFPLAPASRTEILKIGKWHQIWPNQAFDPLDQIYTKFWHKWNDVQETILLSLYFIGAVSLFKIPLYITGLSLHPNQYQKELSWITDYQEDNDFSSLGMPLEEFDIGTADLDRKLKSLKAIHQTNLSIQPEYFSDVYENYFMNKETQQKYGYLMKEFKGHPNDDGYHALCDYFAKKIGLC